MKKVLIWIIQKLRENQLLYFLNRILGQDVERGQPFLNNRLIINGGYARYISEKKWAKNESVEAEAFLNDWLKDASLLLVEAVPQGKLTRPINVQNIKWE